MSVAASAADDVSGATVRAPGSGHVRAIALAAVLLLAICAVIALQRFEGRRKTVDEGDLAAQAGLVAARLEGAIDPRRLIAGGGEQPIQAVATAGGRILAIRAPGGADQATTLQEAFSLTPADVEGGKARGKLPNGTAVDLAVRPAGGGG